MSCTLLWNSDFLRHAPDPQNTLKLFQDLIFDQLKERNSDVCVVSGSFDAFYESKNHLSKKKQFLYQSHCQQAVNDFCASNSKREKLCYEVLNIMKRYMRKLLSLENWIVFANAILLIVSKCKTREWAHFSHTAVKMEIHI